MADLAEYRNRNQHRECSAFRARSAMSTQRTTHSQTTRRSLVVSTAVCDTGTGASATLRSASGRQSAQNRGGGGSRPRHLSRGPVPPRVRLRSHLEPVTGTQADGLPTAERKGLMDDVLEPTEWSLPLHQLTVRWPWRGRDPYGQMCLRIVEESPPGPYSISKV